MDYIILDLEWNQYSSQKDRSKKGIAFEIVEIGAIKLDENKNEVDEFNQVIRPQIFNKMHFMTKRIVHIDSQELENGKGFPDVIREFMDWCGDDYIFCTWGSSDLTELQRNMSYYHIDTITDGPLKYIDVQKLFSLEYEDGKLRRSLEHAVDHLHIEKDISFHRALSDAHYTAQILKCIHKPGIEEHVSYDVFVTPKSQKEEIHVVFDDYAKYISREFYSKTAAMEDREVISTRCYLCHKNVRKKIKWFSVNGKHYYCLAFCPEHGYMKGKIRMKKAEDGKTYVVKTLKLITEDEVQDIIEKKTKVKKQNAARKRKDHL